MRQKAYKRIQKQRNIQKYKCVKGKDGNNERYVKTRNINGKLRI